MHPIRLPKAFSKLSMLSVLRTGKNILVNRPTCLGQQNWFSPRSLSRRESVDESEEPKAEKVAEKVSTKNEGVDANELSAALQK